MADCKYLGLTAYIKENSENNEKLSVLTEAIDSLQSSVATIEFDENKYENVVQSEAYQYLYDHDSITFCQPFEMPNGTPEAYQRAIVEPVTIKGHNMLKLYIPAVAKDEDKIKYFIKNALRPVLIALFGGDLIGIKTKEGFEYEAFDQCEENILLSAERA